MNFFLGVLWGFNKAAAKFWLNSLLSSEYNTKAVEAAWNGSLSFSGQSLDHLLGESRQPFNKDILGKDS